MNSNRCLQETSSSKLMIRVRHYSPTWPRKARRNKRATRTQRGWLVAHEPQGGQLFFELSCTFCEAFLSRASMAAVQRSESW